MMDTMGNTTTERTVWDLRSRAIAGGVAAVVLTGAAQAGGGSGGGGAPTRCYFVGNSLTIAQVMDVNSIGLITPNWDQVYARSYHTLGGVGLTQIRHQWLSNQLASGFVPSPFPQALATQTYDAMVFQPFFDSASSEVAALRAFVNEATPSAGARVYVYATWPARQDISGNLSRFVPLNYAQRWGAAAPGPTQQVRYVPGRAHFDQVLLAARRANPGREVRMIPAGHVLAEVDARARAGLVPGLSGAEGFFFDEIHLNGIGQYTVAMTLAWTLLGLEPSAATLHPWYGQQVPPAMDAALRSAVADVVNRDASLVGRLAPGACGMADVAGPGQQLGSDGELTADDVIVMVNWFAAGDARADIAGPVGGAAPGQAPIPDGEFTADDLIAFVGAFVGGC
jgi:hypothetical protein